MFKQTFLGISILLTSQLPWAESTAKPGGQDLVNTNCMGCHLPTDEGLSRISYQRKTPEGWEMTINRMQKIHGLNISNQHIPTDASAMHTLVKHLSDTQGLAPSETDGVRYLLEHDLNREEDFEPLISETCGRCHSGARVALQRRSEKEWNYLVDFHLGQWPSTEYSLYGRDRNWLKIAREEVVPKLAKDYPLKNAAWEQWQAAPKPQLSGAWSFSGHMPGKGFFTATMQATQTDDDYYNLSASGQYLNGDTFTGKGKAVVYTGFEWRGNINFGDIKLRQVFAASPDGQSMNGRFYQKGQELMGMRIEALKASSVTKISDVFPSSIRRGETQTIVIAGTGLNAKPSFDGVELVSIISQSEHRIEAKISAAADGQAQYAGIRIGNASTENQLAIYNNVDALEVIPPYGIARIGGNGGSAPKLNTIFRAQGIDYGDDRIAGTADDLQLGFIDNVSWQALPRDAVAEHDEDVKFAGKMDSATGVYSPAVAGPNPARKRSTNNAGNLNVKATLNDSDTEVSALGRLLVAVQVWVNPPLK